MTTPRLEIDLEKIRHNAGFLVGVLQSRGIAVTAVTKGVCGMPEIAHALLRSGVRCLGDARIGNIETMRRAGIVAPIALIRSPMLSEVDRIVAATTISFNTELDVVCALSTAAQRAGRTHGVVLMVELGDLREGIMPGDLEGVVRATLRLPNLSVRGIGANLACFNGVAPDARNMAELGRLANAIDATFGPILDIVSGGNSANLAWALSGADTGRVNQLRLGEAILLGMDPLHRRPIVGLHTDAFTLVGEVIESKLKPARPWGVIADAASAAPPPDSDQVRQSILAMGRQDTDTDGLDGPPGIEVLGASSDHLVVSTGQSRFPIGAELHFRPNYSALMRSMSSPFVAKVVKPMSQSDRHPIPAVIAGGQELRSADARGDVVRLAR